MPRLVDSHAHLTLVAARGIPLRDILASWFAAGGRLLLDAGVKPGDLAGRASAVQDASAALDAQNGQDSAAGAIRFAAGAWPGKETLADPEASLAALEADLGRGAVALGECGLDYYHDEAPRDSQISFFKACCALALRKELPLIVHSRDAFEDTLSCIRGAALAKPAIIHCFSYDATSARAFLDAGCMISFSGSLTYKNASALREAAALVPLDRLLVETDAPYLAPVPQRGKICRPEMVGHTLECLAGIKGIEAEALAQVVEDNFSKIFS